MKAKKPAKPAKKAAKPAKAVAVKKKPAPAKKPAVKAKPAAAKAAKKAVAKKPAAKSVSKVQAAANKLKSLFAKKPTAKPAAAKKAAPVAAKAKAVAAPAKTAIKSKPVTVTSRLEAPKGLLSEAQIRRMSDKEYMNDAQLDFFRHRLLQMREEVLGREVDVKERLHQREVFADPADRATAEEEHWLDLRLRERESLLLRKIDEALRRILEKEFGYCEKTGDPIGIPRLLARPTATVCVDVKGQDERVEAQFRDR